MALVIALAIGLIQRWRSSPLRYYSHLLLLAGASALWVFSRDTNAWVVLCAVPLIIVASLFSSSWRRSIPLAVLLILWFVASSNSAERGERWLTPFQNIVGMRILPDASRTRYFAAHGLPVTPALLDRSGKTAWSDDWTFVRSPLLEDFRDWTHQRGKATYMSFLLTHPVSTLEDPFRDFRTLVSPDVSRFRPVGLTALLGGLADALYWAQGAMIWMLLAIALSAAATRVMLRSRDGRCLVPLMLAVLACPHALVVWHGDATSLDRHAIEIGIQLRLGIWLTALLLAEHAWLSLRESGRTRVPLR
jgi:hypothetical protein